MGTRQRRRPAAPSPAVAAHTSRTREQACWPVPVSRRPMAVTAMATGAATDEVAYPEVATGPSPRARVGWRLARVCCSP